MKSLNGVATMAAIVSLGVGSAAIAQDRQSLPPVPVKATPAPTQTTAPPPVMVPPPPTVAIESEEETPSLFDTLTKSANTRLDPEQRAQALLEDIPVNIAVEPMALAEMFTRDEILHRSVAIDVPVKLAPQTGDEPTGNVWHRGSAPSNRLLLQTNARAASAATATMTWKDGSVSDVELYEARFRSTKDPRSLTSLNGKVYCATKLKAPTGEEDACLIDRDMDGTFDEYAFIAERSGKSVHGAVVLTAAVPMVTPAPYTVRTEGLPQLKAEWTTCGKDWDLPFYQLRLARDEHGDVTDGGRGSYYGDPYCAKATTFESMTPEQKGARIARMGPAVAEISSKKSGAAIQMRRLLSTDELYRIEARDKFAPLSVGFAPQQAQLAANQEHDRLPYQSTGEITAVEGEFKAGEPFITAGFRHGYTGVVTEEVKIRTLLSSRSVEGGLPVYGVPAKRTVVTYGGYGGVIPGTPAVERNIDIDVIWCLPTREEVPLVDKRNRPTGNFKVEWTATCLPDNNMGQHTILKDQSPALAVRSMRMNVDISTNDGPPPVAERPTADFGAPLYFRYSIKEASKNLYTLTEEVLLGDEVTSSTEIVIIKDEDGKALIEIGGGSYALEPVGEAYKLTPMLPVREGEDGRIKGLDIQALMRRLLQNLDR
ncbi:hypothetical protein [Qipengyuania gelatinilytica]|uniref:Uncharacterized protein n=1 Tax=Qipengyuania gelatinilytica TaxID=2867231 RepID=A0ABX9A731_9SPHN|nr:hypothetical protein [Qipengyuania gelatinilytica]QZD95602.1 hypothetical protein K3136_02415 [Qipengyuania gelatinilytica]